MPMTNEEFDQHPIHATIRQFRDAVLANFEAWREAANQKDQHQSDIDAFLEGIRVYEDALQAADRKVINKAFFDAMNKSFTGVIPATGQGHQIDINNLSNYIMILFNTQAGNLNSFLTGLQSTAAARKFDGNLAKAKRSMQEAESIASKTKKEVEKFVEEISKDKEGLQMLVSTAAGGTTGNQFATSAIREKKSAAFWDRATFICIGVAIAFVIVSAFFLSFNAGDTTEFLFVLLRNFSIVGLLVFCAAISASRAKMHHSNAQSAEWLALQVTAIGPYSRPFDPAIQQEFMSEVGKKIFTRIPNQSSGANSKEGVNIAPISLAVDAVEKVAARQ